MISVILPVYNGEKYIKKCIQSILNQTYQDIELIIVNDGSVDDTRKIVDYYGLLDSRVCAIHKNNGGVSESRNIGIANSRGDFLAFVDADDYLPPNALKMLYKTMKEQNVDFVCGSFLMKKRFLRKEKKNIPVDSLETKEKKLVEFVDIIPKAPWGKFFKKSIIEKNDIKFPVEIPYGEDAIFLFQYLANCSSFSFINETVYIYNMCNQSSAMHKYYPEMGFYMYSIAVSYTQFLMSCNISFDKDSINNRYYQIALKHYKEFSDDEHILSNRKAYLDNIFSKRDNL